MTENELLLRKVEVTITKLYADGAYTSANIINKFLDEYTQVKKDLEFAIFRIKDMLEGDDGQAWKEAEKFLDILERRKHD